MYRQVDLLTVQWGATKNPRESWEPWREEQKECTPLVAGPMVQNIP